MKEPKPPTELNYRRATHPELIRLTRALLEMPFGDLGKLMREKAAANGPLSPMVIFIRAVIFSRMVAAQKRGGPP